jgi:O-antigen/teichoic acid export membrane protein
MVEVTARFFVGLLIAGGICFLLVPTFFWPSRHAPSPAAERGFYQKHPHEVPWIFATIAVFILLSWTATTRAVLRGQEGRMPNLQE